ncbi:MAG: fimbrial protein pilin [Microgenomates bacterium 39_7]|nr:MAG: fimbrial protein pilin [Microgenomates bacterium 39_7]
MINKKNAAFTLIEVLVATTIVAVLTAIGVVSYSSASRNSRDAKRLSDVEQIRAALEMYRADNGSYPGSIDLSGSGELSSGTNVYMSPIPQDPKYPTHFYIYSGSDDDYTLTIYLEKNSVNRCFGPLGEKGC